MSMARSARRESATGVYHVMIRGINKEAVFEREKDRRKMLTLVKESGPVADGDLELYAYCIMPNHAHFLVRAGLKYLSVFMKEIQECYAKYYNLTKDRVGYVFQGRFKSECVEEERYFWNCFFYIHSNPVKAGLVRTETEYGYSSAEEYAREQLWLVHEKGLRMYRQKGIGTILSDTSGPSRSAMDAFFVTDRFIMDTEEEMHAQKKEAVQRLARLYIEEKEIESTFILFSTPRLREKFIEDTKEKIPCTKAEISRIVSEL